MKKYLVLILIIVVIVFFKDIIYKQINQWLLIPKEERFTELYFNDHINLPKQISKGEMINFSFVIHNLEGKTEKYNYVVFFKSLDGKIVNIDEFNVVIKDGEKKMIHIDYISERENNTGGVFVELKGKKQAIHFLLNNN
jgi:hypothetical protein